MKKRKVREFMRKNVISANGNETLKSCAKKLAKNNIGCLIVLKGKEIEGIITERDLTRALAKGVNYKSSKIKDSMTKQIVYVSPGSKIIEAARLMKLHNIKHLPVMEKGKLAGMISNKDVIREIYFDKYLGLSAKKAWFVSLFWIFSIVMHEVITSYLGNSDVVFYAISRFVIPAYFVLVLIYTISMNRPGN